MEPVAILHDESSGANLAFRASTRFAVSLGAFQATQQIAPKVQELRDETNRLFADLVQSANEYVGAWHKYLDVEPPLHSDGCMRAAFATVSEGKKSLAKLRDVAEKHPIVMTEAQRAQLEQVLEQLDDILESFALLLDTDARTKLRDVMVEAGLDASALEREDAATEPTKD